MIDYSEKLKKIKPDIVIITGDMIETLAFCITRLYEYAYCSCTSRR